jgi:flagellar basal body rod protein FlgF
LGIVIVEKSIHSTTRLPTRFATKILICVNATGVCVNIAYRDVTDDIGNAMIPLVSKITIVKNCTIMNTAKDNNPNDKIFARILKLILDVIAIVGKKIRKRSCR